MVVAILDYFYFNLLRRRELYIDIGKLKNFKAKILFNKSKISCEFRQLMENVFVQG